MSGLCRAAGVSRAGYYRYQRREQAKEAGMELRSQMQRIALRWPAYGYRRGHPELRRRGGLLTASVSCDCCEWIIYCACDDGSSCWGPASPTENDSQRTTLPYNDFSANGSYPLNFVSQSKGAVHSLFFLFLFLSLVLLWSCVAEATRELVADESAATAGEDRRTARKTGAQLLVAAGGRKSDAAA